MCYKFIIIPNTYFKYEGTPTIYLVWIGIVMCWKIYTCVQANTPPNTRHFIHTGPAKMT